MSGQGHPPYEEEFRTIGQILERDAEPIMERWFDRATAEQVHADADQGSEVMDALLHMLQSLGQQLQEQDRLALEHAANIAREHGQQRSGLGWDIVELVRDYEILHGVILEHLGEVLNERLTYRQAMIIATVVNGTTGSAVEAFNELTQQRLEQRAEQLQRLAMELTQTEHRERRRLAQLLHDNLQQLLVAVQFQVGSLRSEADQPGALERIEQIQALINEASEVSRSLTGQLSPPLLYEVGLGAALQWLARQMLNNHDLQVHLQADDGVKVSDEAVRVILFEGTRELLLNVAKHAKAGEAWVSVEQTEQEVRLSVVDHGAGYEPERQTSDANPPSFGLANIRERMQWLGGCMHVTSAPGKGTRTVLEAPRHLPERGGRPKAVGEAASVDEAADEGGATLPDVEGVCRVLVADDHSVVRQGLEAPPGGEERETAVGDEWEVDAAHLAGLIAAPLEQDVDGAVRLRRLEDEQGRIVLEIVDAQVRYLSPDARRATVGELHVEPGTRIELVPTEAGGYRVKRAQADGRARVYQHTTNHWLFEERFQADPQVRLRLNGYRHGEAP